MIESRLQSSSKISQWNILPDSLFIQCCSYLEYEDKSQMFRACKAWNSLAKDSQIWNEHARITCKFGELNGKSTNEILKFEARRIKSPEHFIERIKIFLNKINIKQKANLECVFGHLDQSIITIEITDARQSDRVRIKESYYAKTDVRSRGLMLNENMPVPLNPEPRFLKLFPLPYEDTTREAISGGYYIKTRRIDSFTGKITFSFKELRRVAGGRSVEGGMLIEIRKLVWKKLEDLANEEKIKFAYLLGAATIAIPMLFLKRN